MKKKCRSIERWAVTLLLLSTTACAGMAHRQELATTIAQPAGLVKQQSVAGDFLLTRFERVRQSGQPATIYIEGDGLAWLSRSEPSPDPTPTDPVALRLAAIDAGINGTRNILYLARPCQYSGLAKGETCDQHYWTTKRFAPEVIAAMNLELDRIKNQYQFTGFNLVGFSGGGAVAALLAEQRHDVISLRTVAGNLDPALFSTIHDVSQLDGSLNPITLAARTALIPQQHFVGDADKIVTPSLAASFQRAAGPSACIRVTLVPDVTHTNGWVAAWPHLLRAPLDCNRTR